MLNMVALKNTKMSVKEFCVKHKKMRHAFSYATENFIKNRNFNQKIVLPQIFWIFYLKKVF